MKLGKFNKVLKEHAFAKHMKVHGVQALIYLDENMWADIEEICDAASLGVNNMRSEVKDLVLRQYIRIARHPSAQRGLKRKYCITDKGRDVVLHFKNKLN
jgi:predicted transcriptional regulator